MKKMIIILLMLILFFGCEREIPNPVINPVIPDVPPTPSNLSIMVADRELQISWDMSDTASVSIYRIYSADSLNGRYNVVDSSTTRIFTASNLQNGRTYYYKVGSVSTDGIESILSSAAYGMPNLFSIIINDGLVRTEDRHITLTMVAPVGTSLMRISNDVDFSQSSWEPFIASKSWLLTEGSGEKTVYAMFRDGAGNITRDTISDNIIYEVLPYSYSIVVNGDAELTYTRDVELAIGAPQGTSYMMISNSVNFPGAAWERFSAIRQWHIPSTVASNGEAVGFYVLFRDSNGDSVDVQAADSIILASAEPVELYPVNQPADSYQAVTINWSRTMSGDFHSYRLFRSRGSSSVDTIITTLFDIAQTSYTDNLNITDLPDDTPESIYYMVRFYSVYDDSSDSDPMQVILINNEPPALSTFISDINYDVDTLTGVDMQATFGWERSDIVDFDSYVVFQSATLDTLSADPVFYTYDQGNLSYDINKNSVDTLEVYYYWLKVFDLGDQESEFSEPDSVYY